MVRAVPRISMAELELVNWEFGKLWVFKEDRGCSNVVRQYGEYSPFEVYIAAAYIGQNDVVMDIGANIGALTIPLAKMAKKVYAVEPQAEVREVLCENLKLAGVTNVEVLPFAVGCKHGTGGYTVDVRSIGSTVIADTGEVPVEVFTLDELGIVPNFIKMDVETAEIAVLFGGCTMLSIAKPTLLIERQAETTLELFKFLSKLGYTISVMDLPMFIPNNRAKNLVNHYPNQGHLMVLGVGKIDAKIS